MQTTQSTFDIQSIAQGWSAFERYTHLRVIHNDGEYENMVKLLNTLLDTVGDEEDHALSSLLELVGNLVSDYEAANFELPKAEPKEVLRFLMAIKQTTQLELANIVPQSNLSAILAGKRNVSPKVAKGLADFFGVTPMAFIKLN